ncbi:HNH endonuclease [Streptomyces rimosus]|uniref:HNH endonuclease n=1 Tax=Streptomyces rimosus TaxID=1927 RepID=UPI002240D0CB|nr:HNH endonuclease signature motif containing protein [Streptomyces rimosus]
MLFSLAEGRCQICSAELGEDWNADHRIPWSEGGPTTIENGPGSMRPLQYKQRNRVAVCGRVPSSPLSARSFVSGA